MTKPLKTHLGVLLTLALGQTSAFAAPAAFDWTGFYAGAHLGGGAGQSNLLPQRAPVQTVTTTMPGTTGGCSTSSGVYPIVYNSAPYLTAYPTWTGGNVTPSSSVGVPGYFDLTGSAVSALKLAATGSPVTQTYNMGQSSAPPYANQYLTYQTQALALPSGLTPGAITTNQQGVCDVVTQANSFVGDSYGSAYSVNDIVGTVTAASPGVTTTSSALVGPFAGVTTDQATLAMLGTMPGQRFHLRTAGISAGAQVGYNHQFNNLVLGVETDIGDTTLAGAQHLGAFAARSSLDWLGTLRGRVGYAFDRFLVYATGGLAYGQVSLSYALGGVGVTQSQTQLGYVAGVGAEWAVTDKFSLKAEYRYVDLGAKTFLARYGYDASLATTANIAELGVNFHF